MNEVRFPKNEVDQLLLNALLRDELEPYMDESVELVDASRCQQRKRINSSEPCYVGNARR